MTRFLKSPLLLLASQFLAAAASTAKPNIILIYADDLGYGDLGCCGSKVIKNPNIDRLASGGLRFTASYATSATCTSSRYGLLTGEYPWRKKDNKILQGDAAMIIPPGTTTTLPSLLRGAGYKTAVVGKWHLGLGSEENPVDWNGVIQVGPRQVGFDYSYIMAATGDRVPTVYVDNDRVVNLDPSDPIQVSYKGKVGNEPAGHGHPDQRKFGADPQHSDTITNGITGGTSPGEAD